MVSQHEMPRTAEPLAVADPRPVLVRRGTRVDEQAVEVRSDGCARSAWATA